MDTPPQTENSGTSAPIVWALTWLVALLLVAVVAFIVVSVVDFASQ